MREHTYIGNLLRSRYIIVDESYLNEYVDLCLSKALPTKIRFETECHHILPKCNRAFPEFRKAKWNLVHLRFADHVHAHYLLYKATRAAEFAAAMVFTLGNSCAFPRTDAELLDILPIIEKI